MENEKGDNLLSTEGQEVAISDFWKETCKMFFSDIYPDDWVFFSFSIDNIDIDDGKAYSFKKINMDNYFRLITEYRDQRVPNKNPLQPYGFYISRLEKLGTEKKYFSLKNVRDILKETACKYEVFAREMCKQFENFVRYSGTNQGIFKHVLVRNCAYLYKYASQDAKNDGIWRDPYNIYYVYDVYNVTNDNNSGCCLKRVLEWIKEIIF